MPRTTQLTPGEIPEGAERADAAQHGTDGLIALRDRRLVCSNAVFSVYFDKLEQPDGRQVVDYLSIVPKTLAEGGISGVAIMPEVDGLLGLVHVFRHPLRAAGWEIPRGFVDPDESVVDAALRELREEAHLEATASNLVDLGRLAPEAAMFAGRAQLYLARQCVRVRGDSAKELGHGALRFFSLAEIADLAAADEIQDPCTLVAYLRYRQLASGTAGER